VAGRLIEVGAERARRHRPESLTAHDLLLSGRAHLHRYGGDAVVEARRLFQDALALEPNYATALALLAQTHWVDWWAGWTTTPERSRLLFHEAAERAVLFDDSDAMAQGEKGFRDLFLRRYDTASHHMEKAFALNPNGTDSLIYLSWHAMFIGRGDLALAHLDRAQRLDPFGRYGLIRGLVHYSLGRYAEAAAALKTVRLRIPSVHAWLAASLARLGRETEARCAADAFLEAVGAEVKNVGVVLPASWLEWFAERLPYERDADLQHVLDGLRAARLE
jgi:adenylate cyclase